MKKMRTICALTLCISLLLSVAQMGGLSSGVGRHLAVVCDLRSQEFFAELKDALA